MLVAAAWLHDLGYTPEAAKSRFHPLDGALHLKDLGVDYRVCCWWRIIQQPVWKRRNAAY